MAFRLFFTRCKLFKISIAKITVLIHNRYDFVKTVCSDYIVENEHYDFEVSASEDEIQKERQNYNSDFSDGFIESVCIYRNIARVLPKYDAIVFHCSAVRVNNYAYCFTAKSGVGKTTHALLWKNTLTESVDIINGDKPIIRFFNNIPYVCGTPWSGKENLGTNTIVPLKSIAFISRSISNRIYPIDNKNAFSKLIKQTFMPDTPELIDNTVTMLGSLISHTTLWHLECNIHKDAAVLAYNAMSSED